MKSVELEVAGRFAYGYLAAEKGTHRLVRQSPFSSAGTRHTSFAAVEVMPVLGEALGKFLFHHDHPASWLVWCMLCSPPGTPALLQWRSCPSLVSS